MGMMDSGLTMCMCCRRRVGDLFSDKTVSSRLVSMARKSVKGVENVYTQAGVVGWS